MRVTCWPRTLTLFAAAICVFFFVAPVSAAPMSFANLVQSDAPVAHYRLDDADGTATSSTGSNNGTYSGAFSQRQSTGDGDFGVTFSEGRILVPDAPTLNPNVFTLEAVFVWNGPNTHQQRIVEKSTESANVQAQYGLSITNEGLLRGEFTLAPGVGISLVGRCPIARGVLIHAALTYDGAELLLYVNGQLEGSVSVSGQAASSFNEPLAIGNNANRERPFSGTIDEVAIFGRALSPAELLAHTNALSVNPMFCATDAGVDGGSDSGIGPADAGADASSDAQIDGNVDGGGGPANHDCCRCRVGHRGSHPALLGFGLGLAWLLRGRRKQAASKREA